MQDGHGDLSGDSIRTRPFSRRCYVSVLALCMTRGRVALKRVPPEQRFLISVRPLQIRGIFWPNLFCHEKRV